MDVMIRSSHYERENSEIRNSIRRPDSPSYDALIDQNSNTLSMSREIEIMGFAGNGGNSGEIDSSSELNRLSGELNQRKAQEMNGLMISVSMPI